MKKMCKEKFSWKKFTIATILSTQLIGLSPVFATLPSGESVQSGSASFNRGANTLDIVASEKVIIDWNDFSIGSGNVTSFLHGGANGASLNRVTGVGLSHLQGTLNSNGSVYLINPNGVLVGPSGVIDTQGSFVASTLDVDNADFLAGGDLTFSGASTGTVVNLGSITAGDGDIILIARQVDNGGDLDAVNGIVGLAAGSEVLLKAAGTERIFVSPGAGASVAGDGVSHSGTIDAIAAELKAAGNLYSLAINSSGSIEAGAASVSGGRVILTANGDIDVSGSVSSNGGSIDVTFGQGGGTSQATLSGSLDTGDTAVAVNVKGGEQDSTLVLNNLADGLLPAGSSLAYNGGDGFDDLAIGEGEFDSIAYSFINPNDGSIRYDDVTIHFEAIEPVIDNSDAVDRVFQFTGGAETITLQNDGLAGFTFIDSTLGESVTFLNPTTSLTIDVITSGSGADTINIEGVDPAFDADLTVVGNADDTVNVQTNALDIAAGDLEITANNINVTIGTSSASQTFNGDLATTGNHATNGGNWTVNGNLSLTGNLDIDTTGGNVLVSGTLTGGGNDADFNTGPTTGSVNLQGDASGIGALTIETAGIAATREVLATGAINIGQAIVPTSFSSSGSALSGFAINISTNGNLFTGDLTGGAGNIVLNFGLDGFNHDFQAATVDPTTGTATVTGGAGDDKFNIVGSLKANLNGGAGADEFFFNAGQSVEGIIDGGPGTDELDYGTYGTQVDLVVTGPGGTDGIAGELDGTPDPLVGTFTNIDTFDISASNLDEFTGTDNNSTLTVSNGSIVYNDGTVNINISGIGFAAFNGGAGDDELVIDTTGVGNPIPNGFEFNGAGGTDSITLQGDDIFTDITHVFTNNTEGSIDLDGDVITYTGLDPITDNMGAVNRIFTFNGGAETIILDNAVAAGSSTIDSNLGEIVTFVNPTTSITINAGTGDDTIDVNGLDTAYAGSLTINGDAGTNPVDLALAGVSLSALTVNSNNGAITDSNTVTVVGAASFDSGTATTNMNFPTNTYGTLTVVADTAVLREADDTNIAGMTIANNMTLNSDGEIFDEAAATTTVGGVATITSGGRDITLGDAGATVTFGSFDITNNVSNGRVTITHTGPIVLDSIDIDNNFTISTVSGTDTVDDGGAGTVFVGDDFDISSTGSVTLDNVGNSFDRIRLFNVGTTIIDDTADGNGVLFDFVGGNVITGDFTVDSSGEIRGRETSVTGTSTFNTPTNDVHWSTNIFMPKFTVTNARNATVTGGRLAMTLGPSNITDDLAIHTILGIDACGILVVGGLTAFTAGVNSDIDLDDHNHEFADLMVFQSRDVDILDTSGGLFIGDRAQVDTFRARNLTISTTGPLHDVGRIRVGQTLDVRTLSSPSGAEIKLDFPNNNFGDLIVQSFLADGVTPALGRLTIKQSTNARVTTITTLREFNLTSGGSITFENTNPLEFPIMRLDAQGLISQAGGTFLTTDQVYITTAQNVSDVRLNRAGNDFDRIIFHPVTANNADDFTLVDDDDIQIIAGRFTGNVDIDTGGNVFFGFNTTGNVDINAAGSIEQNSPLIIGGTAAFTTTVAGSDVDLGGVGSVNTFTGGVTVTAPSLRDFNLSMDGQNFTLQVSPGTPLTDYTNFELLLPTLGGNLTLPSLNVSNELVIDSAGGFILQGGGTNIVSGGVATIRATAAQNVFLTGANDFNLLQITDATTPTQANNLFVTDINDLKIVANVATNITVSTGGDANFSFVAGNNATVNSAGSMSQIGVVTVGNDANFQTTGSGVDVSLDGFGGVPVTVANALTIGSVNAVIRHMKIDSTVTGANLSLVPTDYNSVEITLPGAVQLSELDISNTLTVNAGGDVTQAAGPLTVDGTATFTVGAANSVLLTLNNNDLSRVVLGGAGVQATNLTVNDTTDVTVTGNISGDANITSTGGNVSLSSLTAGGALNATGNSISQAGVLSSTGAAVFNVTGGATGDLNLNGSSGIGNVFGGGATINATGNTMRNLTYRGSGGGSNVAITATTLNNVSLTVDSAIALSAMTLSGGLTVTSIGDITQTGVLSVVGDASFNAGGIGNNITLGQNNLFSRLRANNANNVTVVEVDNITVFNSAIQGFFSVTAGGTITVQEPVNAVGGRNF